MTEIRLKIKDAIQEGLPGRAAHQELASKRRSLDTKADEETIDAGVLILLYKDEHGELNTVFMKRTEYNGHHSAQISFPGGKSEAGDISMYATALRESSEEIGIAPEKVKLIAELSPLHISVSNFMVYPYIGIYSEQPSFNIDKTEVQYLVTCPISELLGSVIETTEIQHKNYSFDAPCFKVKNEIIWGATAMILNEFIHVLKRAL